MQKKLSVVVIATTPFSESGALDEAALRRHLRRLGDAGVSVYVGGSGSSEAYTYTPEERDRVLAIAVEELKGKVQVRAMGCEPRHAKEMVEFMGAAERANVDAAQIFSLEIGHGVTPTPAELEDYYTTVLDSTSLPIYLSSHQASGYFLPIDLVEKLRERYPQIVGMSYGGSNIMYLAELIHRIGDRMEVHCAGSWNALTTLGLGGNGFMGNEGNFSPTLVASVLDAYKAKDYERLQGLYSKLVRLSAIVNRYGDSTMRATKPLMNAFGLPGGYLRPPRQPITAEQCAVVVADVLALDIPGTPPVVKPGATPRG